jgi:hypothetical protein
MICGIFLDRKEYPCLKKFRKKKNNARHSTRTNSLEWNMK